jgi:K+-transporting ATPase ATPase C chain
MFAKVESHCEVGVKYDATSSGGSNYGATSKKHVDRVGDDVAGLQADNPAAKVPIDLVTASESGLDSDLTPGGAEFQIPRIAKARGVYRRG